ncbi:MAG: type I restriction endonuclease subunit M, partial [Actinomycetota bacterium]
EIESLRVLDPSCGSAHFLVEAMRFLGRELHRAYVQEYKGKAPPAFTHGTWDSDWKVDDAVARAANSEARAWCKRRVAERCLFGVDYNPTAASLARVALWIESLAGDRPLSYFEHHVRCGNSLLGTWLERLDKSPHPDLEDVLLTQDDLFRASPMHIEEARKAVREAAKTRQLIDRGAEAGIKPDSIEELEFKEGRKREADILLADARLLFDLRSAAGFLPVIWGDWSTLCSLLGSAGKLGDHAAKQPWWAAFQAIQGRERFFHWELEFPEVFLDEKRPGFDVILGNPPWEKIKPDRKEFYGAHDVLIRAFVGGDLDSRIEELAREHAGLDHEFELYEQRINALVACLKKGGDYRFQDWKVGERATGGDPDLFKFFTERAWRLLRPGGRVGLVLPSAIYNTEGATGLRRMILDEAQVERFYAFENRLGIFPIHRMYKFINLVFRKGKPDRDGFEAAFMRLTVG